MTAIDELLQAIEAEAHNATFPIDREVYQAVGKDPLAPILFAGSLDAKFCCLGRDLGRDEVRHGQPQIGAAGRQVRRGVLTAAGATPPPGDPLLKAALAHILLTNTVPYKPPGNKAYPGAVKERFRPFLEQLLVCHWKGSRVITLGTEAYEWFAPYAASEAAELWAREDRYEAELTCTVHAECGGNKLAKELVVCPLPHPSPLNQRWVRMFPRLLANRLSSLG
jgi:uracil-DNA glycosylase